jgi:hypothetical protein
MSSVRFSGNEIAFDNEIAFGNDCRHEADVVGAATVDIDTKQMSQRLRLST